MAVRLLKALYGIRRRYFTSHQYLKKDFVLKHCPTLSMVADLGTKPLQGAMFERLRDQVLGVTRLEDDPELKGALEFVKNQGVALGAPGALDIKL